MTLTHLAWPPRMRLSSWCLSQDYSVLLPSPGSLPNEGWLSHCWSSLFVPSHPSEGRCQPWLPKSSTLALEHSATQHLPLLQGAHHDGNLCTVPGKSSPPSRTHTPPTWGLWVLQHMLHTVNGDLSGRHKWIYFLPFPGMGMLTTTHSRTFQYYKGSTKKCTFKPQTSMYAPHFLFLVVEYSIRNIPHFTLGKEHGWMKVCEAWKGPIHDWDFSYSDIDDLSKAPNWGTEGLHDLPSSHRTAGPGPGNRTPNPQLCTEAFPNPKGCAGNISIPKPELTCLSKVSHQHGF